MTLPYTSKFYANGTIFDSVGDVSQTYIDVTWSDNIIYYLRDTRGLVDMFDTVTEQLSSIQLQSSLPLNSIVVHQGQVYGFRGSDAQMVDDEMVIYVENENALVQESLDHSTRHVLLSSSTAIRDVFVDDDFSYYVIHNHNQLTKFDKYRVRLFTTLFEPVSSPLSAVMTSSSYPELMAIDKVREYTSSGLQQYMIVLGKISSGQMFMTKLSGDVMYYTAMLPISGEYYPRSHRRHTNYNLTNYAKLRKKYSNQPGLMFKLTLKNLYNSRDVRVVEIPVDTTMYTTGAHHFAFRIDSLRGNVDLLVDGRLYQSVSIGNADFMFQDITYDNLCVGATYFYNNIPLFKKLKQTDRYLTNNCKIQQFKIYDVALTNDQVRLLTLNNLKMNKLVASFPCGQRNEIDQIERVFSFNVPGSKSNSVNIVVKNSDINNKQVQETVKQVIADKLAPVLPATTRINDVVFRNNTYTFNTRISS